MKKTLFVILITAFSLTYLFSGVQQWEYMVVTFGGTYFSDRDNLTLAYLDEGLNGNIQEANILEKNLNILGNHGWELVGITGTIGGDQQLTLKRPYDETISTEERRKAEEIQKSADEKYVQSLIERAETIETTPQTPKRELKELDSFEAAEAKKKSEEEAQKLTEEKNEYLKKAMHDSLSKTDLKILSEEYRNEEGYEFDISLEVLLPKRFLINGDSYRSSSIEEYAEELAPYFELKEFENEEGSSITVSFLLEFDGENEVVGYTIYSYYYSYYRRSGEWSQY